MPCDVDMDYGPWATDDLVLKLEVHPYARETKKEFSFKTSGHSELHD